MPPGTRTVLGMKALLDTVAEDLPYVTVSLTWGDAGDGGRLSSLTLSYSASDQPDLKPGDNA